MKLRLPIFGFISHIHQWRLLTSKDDYGNSMSRHWGGYLGIDQEECRLCNEMRRVPYEITKQREEQERENALRNLTPERLAYWKKYSRSSKGPILIGDGGSVSMLEYGTVFNGGSEVLEQGNDKFFGPKYIFRKGEEVTPKQLKGDAPANPIGQAHLDASHANLRGWRVKE